MNRRHISETVRAPRTDGEALEAAAEAEHEGRKGRGPEEPPPEPARSDDGGPCHNSAGDDVASTKVWKLIRASPRGGLGFPGGLIQPDFTDGSCHARLLVVIIRLTRRRPEE